MSTNKQTNIRQTDQSLYPLCALRAHGVISSFVSGKDVFVALPTGFGKSLCYGCLPGVFTKLFKKDKSIAIVVSPLTALMQDQVDVFKRKGLSAVSVTRDTNPACIL